MFRFVVAVLAVMAPAFADAQILEIVSAASFQPRIAPDSVASVLGSELAPREASAVRDENGALPIELEGVQVQIDGAPARLLYVSPKQINFVVPQELEPGVHNVTIQTGSNIANGVADVRRVAPAIFSLDGSGRGRGAVLNGRDLSPGPFLVESGDRDQRDRRTRLRAYATGLRLAGEASGPANQNVAQHVKAHALTGDGEEIELDVDFAGPATGLDGTDQVDLILPEELDGAGTVELHIAAGAAESNVVSFDVGLLPANQIRLRAVTLTSDAARAGESVNATVRLNGKARRGGLTVRVESDSPFARVPAFVQIAEGKAAATFAVQTAMVGGPQKVNISADLNGVCESASVLIRPAGAVVLQRVSITPSTIAGGANAEGLVTLSGAAHQGVRVTLRSNDGRVRVPASVTVPAGRISATFAIATFAVPDATEVELTAEADEVSRVVVIKLLPAVSITLDREDVIGGDTVTATARLNRAANGSAVVIRLVADSADLQVPASLTIPAGPTTVTFPVRTMEVNSLRGASFSADFSGMTQTVRLKLRPASSDRIESLVLSPRTLRGGERVTATINLEAPATFPAVTGFLGTSASWIAPVPVVFYVPAGRTSAQFTITTAPGWQPQDVTISASSLGGKTVTATLRVN